MAAKDIEAGRAHVVVMLRDRVTRGLDLVGKRFAAFGRGFAAVGGSLAAGSAAFVAPLIAAAKSFSTAGDAVHKMAIRTGASAEFLSEMKFAAEQSGSSIEQLGAAMFRANRRIANATTETGPAVRALKELGLSAQELNAMPTDQKLMVLADALSQMDDQTRAAQLGFEIFGDSFKQIQPLLNEGSEGIGRLRAEAHQLGLTMSTDDANAAAAFGDAMNRATKTIAAGWQSVGAAVAPILTRLLDTFSSAVAGVTRWINANRPLFASILGIAGAVGTVGFGMTVLGGILIGIGAAITALGPIIAAVSSAFAALSLPVVAVGLAIAAGIAYATAIAGVFVYVAAQSGLLSEAMEFLGRSFGRLWQTATATFGGIARALSAGQYVLAAQILWAGVKLAFWQGVGSALKAVSYLWTNAFSLAKRFYESFLNLSVRVFKSIPKLLWAAIKGGQSFAGMLSQALTGDMALDGVVDGNIDRARAELNAKLSQIQSQPAAIQPPTNEQPIGLPAGQDPQLDEQRKALLLRMQANTAAADAANARQKLDQAIDDSKAFAQAPPDTPEIGQLQNQVERGNERTRNLTSSGTFSGVGAALSLGFDTKPQEATAKNTAKLVRLVERGGNGVARFA